jgi:hypothetical protein
MFYFYRQLSWLRMLNFRPANSLDGWQPGYNSHPNVWFHLILLLEISETCVYIYTYIHILHIYIYHHVLLENSQHINMMFVAKKYLNLILITLIFQPIWSDKSHLNVAAILLLFLGWLWLRFTFLAWSNPVAAVGRNLIWRLTYPSEK